MEGVGEKRLSELAGLLFELASSNRLALLFTLDKEPLKLTQLSRKFSTTVQETSRHLDRLSRSKLVERNPEGVYRLTVYGKRAVSLLPTLDFVQQERQFLLTHDLSSLPRGFFQRIGELSERKTLDHFEDVQSFEERAAIEAKQYAWLMADRPLRFSQRGKIPETLHVRAIIPKAMAKEANQRLADLHGRYPGVHLEFGLLDKVDVGIAMNEKIAAISFMGLDGKLDLSQAFCGEAPSFHQWSHNLFNHYWQKTREA